MAYASYFFRKIGPLGPPDNVSPENSLYSYKDTASTLAQLLAAGYFDLQTALTVGDVMITVGSDGVAHLEVTADARPTGGHVTFGRVGKRFISGQATTVSASDTIVTGGSAVTACGASLDDAPVIGCDRASASIGDQAGAPAAGSILLKTWKPTATGDATPIAATTFGKKVNWWAYISG